MPSSKRMRTIKDEVDKNYEAFKTLLPSILPIHRDKFALMKDGKILNYFSSADDARMAADTFITDGLYSIQEVSDTPINLGFFTYFAA